ncbi:hypothetical protein [Pseudomonas profundi]|uniref:hypothetical protein n=1 Tax=Pseudomonas profundi TaxID=1981513 RepID=UPI00123B145E|nr:hypothetical protein [Pseudomonas profundi]
MRLGLRAVCFALCGSSVLLSGCASLPWSSAESDRVVGLLERNGDEWTVQRCRDDSIVNVEGAAAVEQLFQRVAQPGQIAIFVDIEGTVRDDRLLTSRVLRMQSTGRGCADEPQSGQWIARGIGDSWRLVVDRQGIRFDGLADQEAGPVPMIAESLPDGSMSFRGAEGNDLELWLYPQHCFDNAGDYRHLTATLTVDGRRLNGCAYKGTDAATP